MNALRPESETARWYEDKVRRFGYDHRGLGFRSRSSQEKRFEALAALGEFHGRRILDVGCGFGDLLSFLRARGICPLYTGLDICAPMITRCQERFPSSWGRFVVADALAYSVDEPYDYVVASGLFGLEAEGARERIRPTIERLFGWCTQGLAVNFLSARAPTLAEKRIYFEPCDALAIGFALTPALYLDHSYLPNDFTLRLYKTPAWSEEASAP
ncbi:MAG TPA: class I SAM-dependent methyltransferase [Usitatibacter sp.]|nr:class I SAM-dependent methyltransferase [Usitatibacter sp.]